MRQTRLIELVETHNLYLSIHRIRNSPGYNTEKRWKRALIHALSMELSDFQLEKKIREALEFP